MLETLKSSDRKLVRRDGIESRRTFDWENRVDDDATGFRALREISDKTFAPGAGIPLHEHRNVEIVCVIVDGEMSHEDNYGRSSTLRAGDVLRISAGAGVVHVESNPSKDKPLRFIQLWFKPSHEELKPSYEQMSFTKEEMAGRLRLLVSGDREENALFIHQDVEIYRCSLQAGEKVRQIPSPNRQSWLQMLSGSAAVNLKALEAGDGVSIYGEAAIEVEAAAGCDFLLVNLA